MNSQTMPSDVDRPVTFTFQWRRSLGLGWPEAIAVLYAVDAGYCTAGRLCAALPQLAPHRLESALTDLVAVQLVRIGPDQELTLSPDALFLDQLTLQTPPLVVTLPASWQEPDRGFLSALYAQIGVIQPSLAINVLRMTPEG